MRKAEQDILMGIASQNRRGVDCLTTGRNLRKSDAERLVASGHVVARECARVDDDGHIRQPEVWTTGYELTELGRLWLADMKPDPDGYATSSGGEGA